MEFFPHIGVNRNGFDANKAAFVLRKNLDSHAQLVRGGGFPWELGTRQGALGFPEKGEAIPRRWKLVIQRCQDWHSAAQWPKLQGPGAFVCGLRNRLLLFLEGKVRVDILHYLCRSPPPLSLGDFGGGVVAGQKSRTALPE